MRTAASKQKLTSEEYLSIEAAADHKSEYYNGEIFAMSGGGYTHSTIKGNVFEQLRNRLRGKSCFPSDSDMGVHVPATQLYTYPDVSVVCGPPQFTAANETTLTNPTLLVEVLSPSTERYDRTAKFWHYQSIETLKDYVLIARDTPRVEHFFRHGENQWLYTLYQGLEAVLSLPSLGVELSLRNIYADVMFPAVIEQSDADSNHPGPPLV